MEQLASNSHVGGGDGADTNSDSRQRHFWWRCCKNGRMRRLMGSNNDDNAINANITNKTISMNELIYGASAFHAVVKPVCLTMTLASLAVQYINTDATRASGEAAFDQTYQIFTLSDDQSAATNLGLGLVNALVIVCVITVMTFVIVLLYKYKCLKLLIGYMVFASTILLGLLGGIIFMVAINKYQLPIDQISFYITMYNFAIVGVVAIFYQKGLPTYITQGYLIASSVIVAWQLSHFNVWMAWALLIMLALYDLFAVLSPCGPLRALVKLMSKDDAPAIPGLLYEARLAENVTRPGRRRQQSRHDAIEERNNGRPINDGSSEETDEPPLMLRGGGAESDGDTQLENDTDNVRNAINNEDDGKTACPTSIQAIQANNAQLENDTSVSLSSGALHESLSNTNTTLTSTTIVPLAIARVYKLPIVISSLTASITSLDTSFPTAYLQQEHQFSAMELQMNVEVILPRNGGRIDTTQKNGKLRYVIYNRDGQVKRTLLVNEEDGKVMEIVIPNDNDNNNQTAADHHPSDNTIKLGLGDFIFFSVLVSKACIHGFAAFVACFLSILAGLGGTLILLAVFHHALPALPISIFLAVIMFVLTIFVMEPWIEEGIWSGPYYV